MNTEYSTADLAYLAGVLDVSGFAGILYRKDRDQNSLLLEISRDDATIPALFAAQFGGTVTVVVVKGLTRHVWVKRGTAAQAVFRELLPFMHSRKLDIERLCAFEVGRRGGKRVRPLPGRWTGLESRA